MTDPNAAIEIERLKREFVAWAFQLHDMPTAEAAEQFLRTQVHPELRGGIEKLQQLLTKESPAFIRRVAERVGYDSLIDRYPQAADVVHAYKNNPFEAAQALGTLLLLVSHFDEEIIHKVVAAIMAERTRAQLQERFDQSTHSHRWVNVLEPDMFWREIEDVLRTAGQQSLQGQAAHVEEVEPLVVAVNNQGNTEHYKVHSRVRLFDAVRHKYDVEVDTPVIAQRYDVATHVSIPQEKAVNGIQLEMSMDHMSDWEHGTARLHVKAEDLASLRFRGSAVPVYVGKGQQVELHPEYVDGAELPEAPLLSLRMRQNWLEVTRLPACSRLTVFV